MYLNEIYWISQYSLSQLIKADSENESVDYDDKPMNTSTYYWLLRMKW